MEDIKHVEDTTAEMIDKESITLDYESKDVSLKTEFKTNFFLYWLHCFGRFLLNLITLGGAGPRGVCKEKKYLAKHAIIEGCQLKFNGKPRQLNMKNIIWNLKSLLTLGIYSFVKRVNMEKWVIKHTQFKRKDLRDGKSAFTGTGLSWLKLGIKKFFVTIFTLGIMYPSAFVWQHRYFVKNTIVSGKQLDTTLTTKDAYKFFGKTLLLTIVTLGLYLVYLPYALMRFNLKYIIFKKGVVDDSVDLEKREPVVEISASAQLDNEFAQIERLADDNLDVEAYISEYAVMMEKTPEEVREEALEEIKNARLNYDDALDSYIIRHRKKNVGQKVINIILGILCCGLLVTVATIIIIGVVKWFI